jgi:predicted N-formylglutamate amidohydrolase
MRRGSVDGSAEKAVQVINPDGRSPFVVAVDHASNHIPAHWGDLGLPPSERIRHIAWDPGALAVSLRLVDLLDATVVHSTVSRLVIDCNRDTDAPDLIAPVSETTVVPGNASVTADDRRLRIDTVHAPFHAALDDVLDRRRLADFETILICMHSFTPVFRGVVRPWPIGLIHGRDVRYTAAVRDALAAETPELEIGWNEPYSALNGVTYTLEHHGDARGLASTMIEVRNGEILAPSGVELWARRLSRAFAAAATAEHALPEAASLRSQPHA